MKGLSEFINEQKLNKEDLKDLEVCVKVSLENLLYKTEDKGDNLLRTLVKVVDGQINDTYKDFEKKFRNDYDFDLSDPDVMRDFRSAITYCAKQLIDEYDLAEKCKK